MKKQDLPTIADFKLNIDLDRLRKECDNLAEKFVDVRTANPMLCDNHMTPQTTPNLTFFIRH